MARRDDPNPFDPRGSYSGVTLASVARNPNETEMRLLKSMEQQRYSLNAKINQARAKMGLLPEEMSYGPQKEAVDERVKHLVDGSNPLEGVEPKKIVKWLLGYGVTKNNRLVMSKYLKAAWDKRQGAPAEE